MQDIRQKKVKRLRSLATLMDSQFKGPWGLRFGLDALIGLVPFMGDLIASVFSLYIVMQGASLGCGPSVLARMAINVVFENLMGLVPFLGNIFDFLWRANDKNVDLLEAYLANPRRATLQSRILVGLILVAIIGLVLASVFLAYFILLSIVHWMYGLSIRG